MSHIFLLAVASAFYPLLLAAVLLMLDTERPAPLLAAYLAGGVIVSVGLGVAILFALDRSGATSSSHQGTVSPAVDIAVGVLAVLVGLAMATGWDRRLRGKREKPAKTPPKEPWSSRVLSRGSPALAFVVGMVFSLPSFY